VRIEQLRREFDLTLQHTVFPLHPETPAEGMELDDLFAGRGFDLDAMFHRLRQVADEVALPLGNRTRTFNSRRAQELGKWAEQQGHGDAFRNAVYHAYFAEGRNISAINELTGIAAEVELPPVEARDVITSGRYTAEVDADWQRARSLGVTAVPTLHYQGNLLVGFTPYSTMKNLITRSGSWARVD